MRRQAAVGASQMKRPIRGETGSCILLTGFERPVGSNISLQLFGGGWVFRTTTTEIMKTLPVLALFIAALSPALWVVNFALGITILTAAGILAVLALDYAKKPRALSVATSPMLTRDRARSERFGLAA